MKRTSHIILSNSLLTANIIVIWCSAIFAQFLTDNWSSYHIDVVEFNWKYGFLIDWIYLITVTGIILWYEQPIRRVLRLKRVNQPIPSSLLSLSKQRLLNEPYFIITVDFISWIAVGLLFMLQRISKSNKILVYMDGVDSVLTALITVTMAFFTLQFIVQKWLIPLFFPEGGLTSVPGTQKTGIGRTLLSLSFALNCIPLSVIIFSHIKFGLAHNEDLRNEAWVQVLNSHVITTSVVFLCLGFFLSYLVSRNLSRPLLEITKVLKKITSGDFNSRVSVTTSDEIGYTGDVINTMTEGLKERERLQNSINIAKEVQQLLLPRENLVVSGFDIAGKSIYSEETGGDYFDFIDVGESNSGNNGIIVGDVCGHGVGSALFMSTARALLRYRSRQPGSIAEIVNDVNNELVNDFGESGQFMTLFYLRCEWENHNIKWVRAGHDPGIIYDRKSDHFEKLLGPGIPLGIESNWQYVESEKKLDKDQIILIGTDGIWEAENNKGEILGKEPVYEVIRKNSSKSAEQIVQAILDRVYLFCAKQKSTDDITLIIIKT